MDRDELGREIETLRRRHRHLVAGCPEAPSLWDVAERALLWRVFLADVAEPDLDVEVLAEVIVVRGAHEMEREPGRQALLPLPAAFARQRPRMRFVSGVLEIRVEARG